MKFPWENDDDQFDPSAPDERVMSCTACGGDRGFDDEAGRWHKCCNCAGTGDETVEVEPVTLDDLDAWEPIPDIPPRLRRDANNVAPFMINREDNLPNPFQDLVRP